MQVGLLFSFFCLSPDSHRDRRQKETKKKTDKNKCSAVFVGPTHSEETDRLKIHFVIVMDGGRGCFVLCVNHGGAMFRLVIFKDGSCLCNDETRRWRFS